MSLIELNIWNPWMSTRTGKEENVWNHGKVSVCMPLHSLECRWWEDFARDWKGFRRCQSCEVDRKVQSEQLSGADNGQELFPLLRALETDKGSPHETQLPHKRETKVCTWQECEGYESSIHVCEAKSFHFFSLSTPLHPNERRRV